MTSKSKVNLTENGIHIMYEFGNLPVNVQVIFIHAGEELIYLRVFDGKYMSPIVALLHTNMKYKFFVSDIISIKEVVFEGHNNFVENLTSIDLLIRDKELNLLYITNYTVLDTGGDCCRVLFTQHNLEPYINSIKHVQPCLVNTDHGLKIIDINYENEQLESGKLREKGNQFFRSKQYDKALIHYDMAKGYDPFDYRLWLNCSQAYYHLAEYEFAIEEAIIARKMNPFNSKGYYRHVNALMMLGEYRCAVFVANCGEIICGENKGLMQLKHQAEEMKRQLELRENNSKEDKVRNNKNKKSSFGISLMSSSSHDNEENVDPNRRMTVEEVEKRKPSKKALNAAAEGNQQEQETKRKMEDKVYEEERKKQEAKLKEVNLKSKNMYHESLKDARRNYENCHFKEAMELFAKVLAYACPEGDPSAKNGYSGIPELLEIQFIIGACRIKSIVYKVQSPSDSNIEKDEPKLDGILDAMDTLKYISSETNIFGAPAAAHYFLAIAYATLCLNRMAQAESSTCAQILRSQKNKALRWPGFDDIFPETDPQRLKNLNEELYKNNKNWYPEKMCIETWRQLPLDPAVIKKMENYSDFMGKQTYVEMMIKTSIVKEKRCFLGMLSMGDHSNYKMNGSVRTIVNLVGRMPLRPLPKAKCRFKKCISTQGHSYAREEIYDTDVDFKGLVDVMCEEWCTVSYHPCCWKAHKEEVENQFGKMSEKDFLGTECETPDCTGKICSIKVLDEACGVKHTLFTKDKKNTLTPVKQKKKKDKKKAQATKPQPEVKDKKKSKQESLSEDYIHIEETAITPTTSSTVNAVSKSEQASKIDNSQNNDKAKTPPATSNLPIDKESLNQAKIVIKPVIEEEQMPQSKSAKKKKKNKKQKEMIQPDLLGDPLDANSSDTTNEYVARLRLLKQQREAQELDAQNLPRSTSGGDSAINPLVNVSQWLDPENPFYLPQQLRDNPEELERILQTKMIASSSPNLENSTITTLLEFVYEWLKVEGPMSINDDRLRQYVAENFPRAALDHVNHCGGIKQFLMQSIDFAMIDEVICVRDHVMRAQELTKKAVSDRMMSSKFLISDGRKAKKFTHLLEDTKSSCSSSSSSQLVDSGVSYNSRTTSESNAQVAKHISEPVRVGLDSVKAKPKIKPESLGELDTFTTEPLKKMDVVTPNVNKKSSVNALDTFEDLPSATPNVKSKGSCPGYKDPADTDEEDEYDSEDEDGAENLPWQPVSNHTGISVSSSNLKSPMKPGLNHSISSSPSKKEKPVVANVNGIPTDPVAVGNGNIGVGEKYHSDEEEEEEEEDDYDEEEDGDNSRDDTETFVDSLRNEIEEMKRGMKLLSEQNQKLNDKLVQVKSSTNIEISSLKQKVDELRTEKRELEGEKQSLSAARESEARKFKAEMSRMQEEVKSFQSRHSSLEHKFERSMDRFNEIEGKLLEEQEVSAQSREEVKNLQESLTSSSRRAHEAEVKYLCIKKDLSEIHLNRTIDRLNAEVSRMRQLLVHASDDSTPDRATLTRSIVAWDENIKSLRDRKAIFMEEGKRLLGMVNQGRPLNALPPGDLDIPTIPDINVAPLLIVVSSAKKPPLPVATPLEMTAEQLMRNSSPLLPTPPSTTPTLLGESQVTPITLSSPPGFELKPSMTKVLPSQVAMNSGAIPKGAAAATHLPVMRSSTGGADGAIAQKLPDSHKIFIGKIPWDYDENDIKRLFSDLIGEVVGVTLYDKGAIDGKAVPKYGFVTFRYADDQEKALNCGPIMIGNHTLNIQAKEARKTTKPLSVAVGGPVSAVSEPVHLKMGSSAYGLSDISLNATSEADKSVVSRTVSTPMFLHQPPNATASVTKPKFQNLTSNTSVGAIGTPPPKLVRPQPRQPTNGKGATAPPGATATMSSGKEDSAAYKRLIEVCKQRIGKEFSSPDICNALREVRMKNSNSLSGMSVDVIVDGVKQRLRARRPGLGQPSVAPWAGLTQGPAGKPEGPDWQGPSSGDLAPEEQCSICLDALNSSPTLQLQCQHVFHEKCIGGWLKRQSNCPNCRTFALMADEYPSLKH